MLVYDVMQNWVLPNGKLYSEVHKPVFARAQIVNNETIRYNTGYEISYEHYIKFAKEDGYDVYYVD